MHRGRDSDDDDDDGDLNHDASNTDKTCARCTLRKSQRADVNSTVAGPS